MKDFVTAQFCHKRTLADSNWNIGIRKQMLKLSSTVIPIHTPYEVASIRVFHQTIRFIETRSGWHCRSKLEAKVHYFIRPLELASCATIVNTPLRLFHKTFNNILFTKCGFSGIKCTKVVLGLTLLSSYNILLRFPSRLGRGYSLSIPPSMCLACLVCFLKSGLFF